MLFSKTAIVAFALGVTSAYAAEIVPVYVKLAGENDSIKLNVPYDMCAKQDLNGDVEAYQMVPAADGSFPECFAFLTEDCSGPYQAPWLYGGGALEPAQYVGSLKCQRSTDH
ncbi:hypothetical protein P168DRAFT_284658 [Aspergillus campestris IBT 28561]|uniref:Uncharacterized protein n=1 Tax=Aspergillus campestris (strain IBT 28561) TaxID=1392248 RepID=A0A2I1CU20_ASPC2|nr:uncharacterized protein P168DRAFT_284658 [Aspergillus campestris IBT 28561]PKY01115.1 hypothetical protein P168DRAFT_284658 [Aspergillus campestris IBT 28561]